MTRYMIGRLLQGVLVLLVISIVAFAVTRLIPGDPAVAILGPEHATPKAIAALHHQLGLDRPLVAQYLSFIGGAVHLDFGDSLRLRQPVSSVLWPSLWPSLLLVGYASLIAVFVTVPLGVLAATRRNRAADHAIRLGGTLSYATPPFLSGLVLVLIFSLQLGLLPVQGYGSGFAGHLQSLTLPAITIALWMAPPLIRTLRSGMLDALSRDFVESARARGLSGRRVLLKHALRNSVLPTLTVLGLSVGMLLSLSVVVENVFSIPGLGTLLVTSVGARDYPVIQGLIVVFATAVVICSLVTDLLYVVIDPRIRL
jgi:peptide/nickel transport system permease protein